MNIPEGCKAFVSVYKPVAGWKAILYWFNEEEGGFWEPWDTGYFAYATKAEAISEAKDWAEAEEIPYLENGEE